MELRTLQTAIDCSYLKELLFRVGKAERGRGEGERDVQGQGSGGDLSKASQHMSSRARNRVHGLCSLIMYLTYKIHIMHM